MLSGGDKCGNETVRDPSGCDFYFSGHARHAIDEKGRVAFPKVYRDLIPSEYSRRFAVCFGFDHSAEVHLLKIWKEFEIPHLLALDREDTEDRMKLRAKWSTTTEVELDSASRLLLPRYIIEYAGLELNSECYVVGMGSYIEIVSVSAFEAQMKDVKANFNRYASKKKTPAVAAARPEVKLET
jgi:MraZ protein